LIPFEFGIKILPLNSKVSDLSKLEGIEWLKNMFLKDDVFPNVV
jgi:hypothetical protein